MRFNARSAPSSEARAGRRPGRVFIFASALLVLLAAAPLTSSPDVAAQPAAHPSVDALLRAFAGMPGLFARFHEEKHVALLSLPLESEGEIYFAPPGRMLRKVTSPTPSWALLEGDQVTLVSPGERRVLDLAQSPVVRGFVGAFRDVLAGDRAALERSYTLDFSKTGDDFTLTLRPRAAPLTRFLRELSLHGHGLSLTSIRMVETSGDETLTTFSEVDPARHYSADQLSRLFRLPE